MMMALELSFRSVALGFSSFQHNNGVRHPSQRCNLTCKVSPHSVMAMSKRQNTAQGGKNGKRPSKRRTAHRHLQKERREKHSEQGQEKHDEQEKFQSQKITQSQRRRPAWMGERLPFIEEQLRIIREHNKVEMIDIDRLMKQSDNRYALVLDLADEAREYQLKNRDTLSGRSPILKVLSDRMIDEGFDRPDSYFVDERHNVIPETWDRIYGY